MSQGIFGGGDGSSANPYVVEDAADLSAMRFYPSASYVLGNSINLGVYPYNVGKGWLPIKNFTGSLDGNGLKIMNLFINRPLVDSVGFLEVFSNVAGVTSTVHDVCFENANVTGRKNVGILAGIFEIAQNVAAQTAYFVEECRFTGAVSGSNNVGGVFGALTWTGTLAWNPLVLRNVETSASINPTSVGLNYAALIGWGDGHGGSCTFTNVITTATFNNVVNGSKVTTLTAANISNWIASSKALTTSNVFYDDTLLPYGPTDPTGIDSATITLRTGTGTLDSVLDSVLFTPIWNFSDGVRPPRLTRFMHHDFLVRSSDGYMTYDATAGLWNVVLTSTPTRAEATSLAMSSVSSIPQSAWAQLRAKYATVDLLSVVDRSNGTTYSTTSNSMTADAVNSTTSNNVFRKTISFADCGDAIVSISKEVVK